MRAYGAAPLAGMIDSLIPREIRRSILLHLDHCDTDAMFIECLEAGWDSVMIDASARPLQEDIRRTREVVALAASFGAIAEGEIGVVGGEEDGWQAYAGESSRPAPEEVLRFIDETQAPLVAVGVGTKHGYYEDGCQVDQELLEAIHTARPDVALVLHGGSGIPREQIHAALSRGGIRKINISTEIKDAWLNACREHLNGAHPHQVIAGVKSAIASVERVALSKIALLDSISA